MNHDGDYEYESEEAAASPIDWHEIGYDLNHNYAYEDGVTHTINDSWDTCSRFDFMIHSNRNETVPMLFQFQNMKYATNRYRDFTVQVPSNITFRGVTGFWYSETNVGFVVPLQTKKLYSFTEEDFTWPSFPYSSSYSGRTLRHWWGYTHSLEFGKIQQEIIKVDFDKSPVKAGICLDGASHDVRGTVMATITPKGIADKVSFESSNPNRATVTEDGRVDHGNSKVVTLKVTGVSATPKSEPDGDTELRAVVCGQVCSSNNILILVPETQSHAVGSYSLQNYVTDGNTKLWTKMSSIVTITIRDQFGALLDSVYDGEDVVSETFSSYGGADFYPAPDNGPLYLPNNYLTGGIKEDEASAELSDQVSPALTQTQVNQWVAETLLLPGGHNNIFAMYGSPTISDHLQSITVHGHEVAPDSVRTLETFPNNHPPVPFRVTDEEP